MLRSVVVEFGSAGASFLIALQRDLYRFGREDVLIFTVGDRTVFTWNSKVTAPGSEFLREASLVNRLSGKRAILEGIEDSFSAQFFQPFDIEADSIDPEIVACAADSAEERLFEYTAFGQSLKADVNTMRAAKFLVFDARNTPQRLFGIIGLKSPYYFNGARDRYLGWPPLFERSGDTFVKNQAAIDLRNAALKSIYNVSICKVASPYDQLRIGRLLSSLCFAPEIIDHVESKYGNPVLGMTTTCGWGRSAGQYERIHLKRSHDPNDGPQHLFKRAYGNREKPTLNVPLHLFDVDVFDAAYKTLKSSQVSARPYKDYRSDPEIRVNVLKAACRMVALPKAVLATNVVGHYFGAVSEACVTCLKTINGLATPPNERSIAIAEAIAEWRVHFGGQKLRAVSAERLSHRAS